MGRPEQPDIQRAVEAEHQDLLHLLASALQAVSDDPDQVTQQLKSLQRRLATGWLTPASVWVTRLQSMRPKAIRAIPPLLVRKIFWESPHLQQAHVIQALRKVMKPALVAELVGVTERWLDELLTLTQVSEQTRWLLEHGFLTENQVRAQRRTRRSG